MSNQRDPRLCAAPSPTNLSRFFGAEMSSLDEDDGPVSRETSASSVGSGFSDFSEEEEDGVSQVLENDIKRYGIVFGEGSVRSTFVGGDMVIIEVSFRHGLPGKSNV